jgi:transmembrane sensor
MLDDIDDAAALRLVHGEAAFLYEGAGKPLSIVTGNARTVASWRASFTVKYLDEQLCVTCLKGDVDVVHGSYRQALHQGQRVLYGAHGQQQIVTVDPEQVAAWREGVVVFRHMPLVEAVSEINRYRPGRIVMLDKSLGHNEVSGRFAIHDLDRVIDQIRDAFGIHVTHLPGGLVLLG